MATKGYTSYEEYLKLKDKTSEQSYKDRHKLTDKGLYIFSWFGNAVSIFLSYFFIKSLFDSAFTEINSTFLVGFIIIFFLTLFELLKRHIFGLFSSEFLRNQKHLFKSKMFGFNLSVVLLVTGSFYLSMNGAKRFMNNEKVIITQTETNVTSKIDSLNSFYFNTYIKPLQESNKSLDAQNTEYLTASQKMFATKYTNLINQNNKKIDDNNSRITKYESERDIKITQLKTDSDNKLLSKKDENYNNIIIFILISFLVESVIMIGIYFDKLYDFKIVQEFETEVLNKPTYKKWSVYNTFLDCVFEGIEVGDDIPSANDVKDIVSMNEIQATPVQLENFFKMMYYLKVIERRGSKRTLNIPVDKAKEILKKYYKIE